MYKVSDEVRQMILNIGNGVYVNYILTFSDLGLTIDNDTIYQESIKITQSLCEDEELTLGGCIASSMTFEASEIIDKDINNCRFSVGIQLVDDVGKQLADTIPMGVFTITDAQAVDDKDYKSVTAYDDMHYKASADVADWYNRYFPIVGTTTGTDTDGNTITTYIYGKTTLGKFRRDLLDYLGISYVSQELPNDDMVVEKTVAPSKGSMSGQTLLKMICTLHGGFGIINRNGLFEVTHITGSALFPEETLYPEENLYPEEEYQYVGVNGADEMLYPEYRNVTYEEYICSPVTCINMCNDSEDTGVTVGNDISNPYVICANYFIYGKSASDLRIIGENILKKIEKIIYKPCTIDAQGLPYIDIGDAVALEKKTVDVESFIFSRTLSGIQNLREEYSAKGSEIRENEVSANEVFEQLRAKTMKISKTVDGLSVDLADLGNETSSRFEQTAESILAEVTRAKKQEASIRAEVSEQGSEIVLKVDSKGRIVQVGLTSDADNGSTFYVDADNINLSAVDVINLLAGGTINLTGKNITITSDNFTLDSTGHMTARSGTFSGDITGATGTFSGDVSAETVTIYSSGGMSNCGRMNVRPYGVFIDGTTVEINGDNLFINGPLEVSGALSVNGSEIATHSDILDIKVLIRNLGKRIDTLEQQ